MSKRVISMLLTVVMLLGVLSMGVSAKTVAADTFLEDMTAKFADESLPISARPQARWWLSGGYHTDETLKQEVQNLYDAGYGGIELLDFEGSNSVGGDVDVYGWGSEEWYHDCLVVVTKCAELGMSVSFAAGPQWQPTFPYYGNTVLTAQVPAESMQAYILRAGAADRDYVTASDAQVYRTADGAVIRAAESGSYGTTYQDGITVVTELEVPEISASNTWNVAIEAWSQGAKHERSETVEAGTRGNSEAYTTTEVYYDTQKTIVLDKSYDAAGLKSWKDIDAADWDFSAIDSAWTPKAVSGVGFYSTTVTLPEDWDAETDGLKLELGQFDGYARVAVNQNLPNDSDVWKAGEYDYYVVNAMTTSVDLTEGLKPGENEIQVAVITTLSNVFLHGTNNTNGTKEGESSNRFQAERCWWIMMFGDDFTKGNGVITRPLEQAYGLTDISLSAYTTAVVDKPDTDVVVSLSGDEAVTLDADHVAYQVRVESAEALATATITMELDDRYLGEPTVEALNGFYVIASEYVDGKLTVVIGSNEGLTAEEAVEILSVTAPVAGTVGKAAVSITDAVMSAYFGADSEVFLKVTLDQASVETEIRYSIYDVNRDGVVNQLDLTRAQRYYGTDDAVCDVDGSGEVNIADLILILNHYTQ